ncbi:sensor histidine kinase [Niallia sp. 01092]|uniref:sensor histidine kinase n=1 Tax=unclassified Niallia TaxID=2837522 RepID=UPI003FD4360A
MIISFLTAIIGIIPTVLAVSVLKLYKGSKLAIPLLFYMLAISLWQLDIAVLYLKGIFSESLILWVFRIFRAGPTFLVPLVFYVAYISLTKHAVNLKNTFFNRFLLFMFNKKVLVLLFIWSTIIYILNMTELGVRGLKDLEILQTNTYYYFPQYGPLHFLYFIHIVGFVMLLAFSYIIAKNLQNNYYKDFLSTFFLCSFLLIVFGSLNFTPGTGALYSSLGVIIFSVIIIFSFLRINTMMTVNYNRLIERQKKLDYTGNLTASLVHEVKNSLVVINGYSKLLSELEALPKQGYRMNSMIHTATQQIDELIQNYMKYIKNNSIDYKMVDLNEIIDDAIKLTKELTKENSVEVSFVRKYKTLKAYVNQTYLKQVLINLIKNSVEAIPKDRGLRKITISTNVEADMILLNIIDTGKGIPIENWETIFDPFITDKKEGFGLGLPFVKKIMFEHRGDIKVVDSSSNGTNLLIILPQFIFSDFKI